MMTKTMINTDLPSLTMGIKHAVAIFWSFMAGGSLATYFCLHLVRTASVSARNVLFLLSLGLHLRSLRRLVRLGPGAEGDAALNDGSDVVASECCHGDVGH